LRISGIGTSERYPPFPLLRVNCT